jgi:glucose dehydrogenase
MPRTALFLLALLSAAPAQRAVDWSSPGGDPGARRFSALTQITRANVSTLRQAWSFDTGARNLQGTPTVIAGVMYVTGGSSVFALEPETGKQMWRFDARVRVSRRGVAHWPGTARLTPRLYVGTEDGRLIALDARTGEPIEGFGNAGGVDLKQGIGGVDGPFTLDSPAVVFRNVLITGGSNNEGEPSTGLYGDIRGWDARDGRLLWSFHTVPRAGEPGVETWEADSWKHRSGTNAWTYMTLDPDRGLVFAATGSATSDFYGAERRGKNLYANSLVALDAATGRLRWHQQLVHHDLWDWDLPAAPTLLEVRRGGRTIPAVAQMTKMSLLFIFDRTTGAPLFGIEERPVPASTVPGEAAWPTQPFPLKPGPLAKTSFDPATEMYALTPEHAAYCRDLWDKHRMFAAQMFTPSPLDRTMVMFPSTLGGGNWSGLSYDPGRRLVFTNIMNLGQVARMEARQAANGRGPYRRTSPWGSAYARFWNPETKVPCSSPPFGELVAVRIDDATVAWRVTLGVFDDLTARGVAATGTPNIGGTIATASGIIFVGATIDRRFRAFDADNGALLWEAALPASAHATPMTFMGRDGRQYVVVAAGGDGLFQSPVGTDIVAFSLGK